MGLKRLHRGLGLALQGKNNTEIGLEKQMVGQAGAAQEEQPRKSSPYKDVWANTGDNAREECFQSRRGKNKPQSSALVQSSPCYLAVYYSRFFSIPEQHQRHH